MEIGHHWQTIRKLFHQSFGSSLHFAVATTGEDGSPSVVPIGSLFLRRDTSGFFLEKYLRTLPRHVEENPRVCVLAVNSSKLFWFRSLLRGEFLSPPAVRLYGTLGQRREATQEEIGRFQRRIRLFRRFKGYNLLWRDFTYARDIYFDGFEPVEAGAMGRKFWKD